MPFDKVETQVDFPAQERAVLEFWERTQAFEKLRAQNRGKPKWSFLDGPITANNPMGVHHAWGRTYKDLYQRYFAMTGHAERYQNGFDCQGLWVEVEVERELKSKGIKMDSKRDIENLVSGDPFASIDHFVQLCKQRVDHYAKRQTEQSIRLGYWMDWDKGDDWQKPPDQRRSYFTMSEENNYTIWSFLKKCHERGLVYRGYDAMPWCPRCAVGLSQMEMHEGYQMVAHRAVFVRFPLRNRHGEYLLVWTTTPWTLTSNVAAAVNPYLTYVKVRHRDEVYYLARGALTAQRKEEEFKRKEWVAGVPKLKSLEQIFKEKGGFEVVRELSGAEMVGWTYEAPFDYEVTALQHPGGYPVELATVLFGAGDIDAPSAQDSHRVIAWDVVGAEEGTGIVHIAPGCGKEDFLLGKANHLPAVAPLDEEGVFLPGFMDFVGLSALDPATTDKIIDKLQRFDALFAQERYPHSYPHCWRCKTELLFRLVDEWFINMSWRDEIMRVTEQATFLPEAINGKARELDWLRNMGDWMISKKRFWGLALPIWVCESCNAFDVIGSRAELKERAVTGWETFDGHSPHRPWVDQVTTRCQACGGTSRRIPDVGNPWLDAGIVPYSTMKYNTDRAYWEEWFPADFITESFPGQFRNWFYAILAMSTMMEQRVPFKVLLGHALVRDENGQDMHKSKGNAIPFEGAADEGYWLAVRDPQGKLRKLKPGETREAALKSPLPDLALALDVGEVEDEDGKKVPALLAKYPPMGADVLRWMYGRQNPALNINFGPHPANEVRSRFFLKLWNTYAFFCNYARLDTSMSEKDWSVMDNWPDKPLVLDENCSIMDMWILSDLQKLIQASRKAFEEYNVQAFCLEAERFVDDKLSNWYVRRERRRFWKEEQTERNKAAYRTLYTVLVTLTKLIAPIAPFLAETMYQNLSKVLADRAQSVHLCPFPEVREDLSKTELSEVMEDVLRIVSLGSAARNLKKIKVRQPLKTMGVRPRDEKEARALQPLFIPLIRDELNIKDVHQAPLRTKARLNMQRAGPRFGRNVKDVEMAVRQQDSESLFKQLQVRGVTVELRCPSGIVQLEPADVSFEFDPSGPEEGWVGLVDRGTIIAIDPRIDEKLRARGRGREVVRHFQQARKDAGLKMEDRIVFYYDTDSTELREDIEANLEPPPEEGEPWQGIMKEILAIERSTEPLGEGAYRADVKVDGQPLRIELRKVTVASR
jgi:isoleucyl-tRNA synthetase